jgi:isopenicillin-N epimerase
VSVARPQPPEPVPGARLLFSLDPAVTYLNHGAFGAVPIGVQRVQQRLRDEVEADPARFFSGGLPDRIAHTRRHLASFLGADPDGAALVGNATAGVSTVLRSLRLAPGDEVVTTDHAYGAVRYAVEHVCRLTGATRRSVPVPPTATDADIVEAVRGSLRPGRTRLLIVDQLSSPTARLFPVPAIVAVARESDVPVLVDGAHAPGMLSEAVATGADFWVGNLHKWAFAPRGTGLLVVARRWRSRIEPSVVSWEQPTGFPSAVEYQGTLDYTSWLAAPAGLFTLRTLGVERVRAHNAALTAYGQHVVATALGVAPDDLPRPGGPAPPGGAGPGADEVSMRLVPLPAGVAVTEQEAAALRRRIADELTTQVAVVPWGGRGWLRLCGQVYNRAEEYDRLAGRLPALLTARA